MYYSSLKTQGGNDFLALIHFTFSKIVPFVFVDFHNPEILIITNFLRQTLSILCYLVSSKSEFKCVLEVVFLMLKNFIVNMVSYQKGINQNDEVFINRKVALRMVETIIKKLPKLKWITWRHLITKSMNKTRQSINEAVEKISSYEHYRILKKVIYDITWTNSNMNKYYSDKSKNNNDKKQKKIFQGQTKKFKNPKKVHIT